MDVREAFRIAEAEGLRMLERIERAVSDWRSIASALPIESSEMERLAPAFEHSQRDAARRLLRSSA